MMWVQIIRTSFVDDVTLPPGKEIELPKAVALGLIRVNKAVEAKPKKKKVTKDGG